MPQGGRTLLLSQILMHAFAIWQHRICWAFHQHWNGLRCSIDSFTTGCTSQHTCQTKKVCMWVICGYSQFSDCIYNQDSSGFSQKGLQALESNFIPMSCPVSGGVKWHFSWLTCSPRRSTCEISSHVWLVTVVQKGNDLEVSYTVWKMCGKNLGRIFSLCTVSISCFLIDTVYTLQCFICFVMQHISGFRLYQHIYILLVTKALISDRLLFLHLSSQQLYIHCFLSYSINAPG